MARATHIVEPVGRGGIYQHALELARLLAIENTPVVFHTARDHEGKPHSGVEICQCMNWFRNLHPKPIRSLQIAVHYLVLTVPHLRRQTDGCVVHIHGPFKIPLIAWTLRTLSRGGSRRVLFSPHNTFARSGRRWEDWLLRRASSHHADLVIVFSTPDAARATSWGAEVVLSPLVMPRPRIASESLREWRQRLAGPNQLPVLLFAGQVRRDKGLERVIGALPHLRTRFQLAVVGEDKGDLERCRAIAEDRGASVIWVNCYLTMSDFAAAVGAASVVVCAYEQASQSGVIALANALGVPTVATPVGGLAEQASVVARGDRPEDLADAIEQAFLTGPHVPPETVDVEHLLRIHAARPESR